MADLEAPEPVLSRWALQRRVCRRVPTAGGYGWNSRVYGLACENVLGLDVVTADGEQVHCDENQHADLYWAARGSGPGFSVWSRRFTSSCTRGRRLVAPACTSTRSTTR